MLDAVLKTSGGTSFSSGGGSASTPQYWQLVTTDAEGNPLDEAQYYLQPVSGQHLRMPGDVVAYAVDPAEPMQLPVAADYNTTGLFRAKEGGGLLYDSVANAWYVDPEFQGGGGIDEGQLEEYLTTNNYITQSYLQQNGYLTWESQLTAYQKPDAYSPITPTDTLMAAIGKLEANFGNYVDLTTNQTVGGVKTFTERVLSQKDVIAYAAGDEADLGLPVTGYATTGLVRIKEGGGIIVDSSGIISVDPEYAGGGGVDFTAGTALQLTSAGVLNVLIGTTSGTVCAGNDSRLSNDRPNPYSLSWSGYSSGSYDGSSAKSIVIPSNTNQLTNGAGFIKDANGIITVLSGSGSSSKYLAGNGTFYTISYSELSGTPNLGLYVKKAGDTMTGQLTLQYANESTVRVVMGSNSNRWASFSTVSNAGYSGAIKSSDAFIFMAGNVYNNRIELDGGNLMATGDIVAYGTSSNFSDFVPVATSSVYGIVKYDGTTIGKNSSGQLYVIGGGGSSGGGSVAWGDITGKPSWIGSSKPSYSWSEITSKPSWIGSSKPSYSWSEISSKPSWIGSSKPSYSWSEISNKPSILSSISYSTSGSGNVVTNVTASGSTVYVTKSNLTGSFNGGTITNPITKSGTNQAFYLSSVSGGWAIGCSSSEAWLQSYGSAATAIYCSGYRQVWITTGSYTRSAWQVSSDMRDKTKVSDFCGILDMVPLIDVFRYTRNEEREKRIYIGVSAQQLKTIFPEFVSYDDYTERYAVGYDQLGTAVAIQGIKELYARFRPVESKVKVLEQRVRNLQSRLDNAYREIFNLKEGKEDVA